MSNTLQITTDFSIYEVDFGNNRVRRVSGVNKPTPRQGADGEWKTYMSVSMFDHGLIFQWGWNANGTARCTHTSSIKSVKEIEEEADAPAPDKG
jgi:hypothetical protein